MIAKDFKVGQTVFVAADQGIRKGEVTKVARTRIHVRHPRNKKGDMVERAYPMLSIVLGASRRDEFSDWRLHFASGDARTTWSRERPDCPILQDEMGAQ